MCWEHGFPFIWQCFRDSWNQSRKHGGATHHNALYVRASFNLSYVCIYKEKVKGAGFHLGIRCCIYCWMFWISENEKKQWCSSNGSSGLFFIHHGVKTCIENDFGNNVCREDSEWELCQQIPRFMPCKISYLQGEAKLDDLWKRVHLFYTATSHTLRLSKVTAKTISEAINGNCVSTHNCFFHKYEEKYEIKREK